MEELGVFGYDNGMVLIFYIVEDVDSVLDVRKFVLRDYCLWKGFLMEVLVVDKLYEFVMDFDKMSIIYFVML